MNAPEHDDDGDRTTPVAPDSEYPPRNTGRYRMRALPEEVPIPAGVKGTPNESFFLFIQAEAKRRDKIEKERRFAEASWREEYDRRLDASDARIEELALQLGQVASTQRQASELVGGFGELLDALKKDFADHREKTRKELNGIKVVVERVRKCVKNIEVTVAETKLQTGTVLKSQGDLTGRVESLEKGMFEVLRKQHDLEEVVDDLKAERELEELDDEGSDDDAAETPETDDPGGAGGDAPPADDPAGSD